MKEKIHHCFNCGEETEDYDELPNGRKMWICGSKECIREFTQEARAMEAEARENAQDDNYSRYY